MKLPAILTIASLLLPGLAAADPVISEFLANNVTGLQDDDGQRGDWIEIHNPDTTAANLTGWHLTDKATNLGKWTFPSVTLPPKGFLLVWATEKNRTNPAAPLHTNFKLDAGGEYLALTRPDNSVAHAFAPVYPPQAPDVAYGVPVTEQQVTLATQGSPVKVNVPADDSAGTAWRDRSYNDNTWTSREAGVGFDKPVAPVPAAAQWADSAAEFSGTQGQNGWHYGYWNRTADADKLYTAAEVTLFPRDGTNTLSATNAWNGGNWDINAAASAPWTEMTSGGGHPNGANSGDVHWTVRRYVSEFTGTARLVGTLADGAECGDGVALRIFLDGAQVYFRPTFSSTPLEFSAAVEVQAGQKIDFVIDPLTDDGCDGHAFSVKVLSHSLADSVADWSANGLPASRDWSYGYYRRSADGDGVYQTANFSAFPRTTGTAVSGTNAWNGTNWQLTTTTPVTALTSTGGSPAVTGATDWPARRWTSTYTGRVRIAGAAGQLGGGDGITGRIFVNGTPVFSRAVTGTSEGFAVLADVSAGSVVDFLIDPNANETGDAGAVFFATISPASVGAVIAADSITGYGTGAQGANGWSYGYYNKTDDAGGVYADTDFNSTDANWTLAGGNWSLGPADPPWTSMNSRGGHPNGTNSGGKEHWIIRRWTSTVSGPVTVDYHLSKAASGGGGTSVKVFLNGTEKDGAAVSGTDRAGLARSVALESVTVGDRIDIALSPVGVAGATDDGGDSSNFSARVLHSTLSSNVTISKIADSTEDWSAAGTQGYRGWNYGYYNKTADTDGTYQAANFSAFLRDGSNTVGAANHWNGSLYDLNPAAGGPWTELAQEGTHPNGTNSAPGHEQWTIRRWVSTHSGPLSVSYKVWKTNPNGGGVSIRAFHNGTQMDTVAIAGNDSTGATRSFAIPNAAAGDFIDVALSPVGLGGGTDDGSDGSAFRVTIHEVVPFSDCIDASAGDIGPQMSGVNATAYLRLPLSVPGAASYDKLKLRMKYDDGFVAWLNGTEVARSNAPEAAAGGFFADSVAEFSGTQGQANWFYGYYNTSADADGTYQTGDFTGGDPNWTYAGGWALGPGDPPWTSMWNTGGHPNGPNSGANQQPIRRWVAESSGTLTAHIFIAKSGVCDSGITGILYHKGAIIWQKTIGGADTAGHWADVSIPGVQTGDAIDLAMDARGTDGGTNDFCDATTLTMTVDQQPSAGLGWNAAATATRAAQEAGTPVEFDLSAQRFLLQAGATDNVLAIHGLNRRAGDPDFLLAPELIASVITADVAGRVYFVAPTPGNTNGDGTVNIGPVVVQVTDSPAVSDADPIAITARVTRTIDPVGTVTLFYRTMYGPEASLVMLDDGLSGDSLAGDGIYGATIPAAASAPGEMVRWRITATDTTSDLTKSPPYSDPSNSPEYWGTVITVPNAVPGGQLPVMHWFTNNPSAHDGYGGGRCAIFFNGQFFDNVGADLHGQSSSGFPKKSYDFDLNSSFKMEWDTTPLNTTPKVNSFNLLTTYPDKANLRNILSYRTFAAAGVPGHWAQPVQVRRNNAFYSVAHMVEDGDSDYLQRAPGLDDQGALYKMYNTFYDAAGGEKKSRKWEGSQDLTAFIAGLSGSGVTRERFLYDHAGIPETINYLTAQILTGNDDCCHKNYYVYRDSEGNREWRPLPWDVDLSYGRVWREAESYYRDTMTWNTSLYVGQGNLFMTPFADNSIPVLRQMYLRRLRTLVDTILQPASVPLAERWVENQLNLLQPLIQPEADYERLNIAWGTWGIPQTMTQALDIIRNDYLPQRRTYVFSQPELPPSQSPTATVNFGTVVFDPASHTQSEEYFTLTNPNPVAVDVSNWVISGAVQHTLKPGTVIPAGGTLYLSPDVNAFRARATSPKGNEGLFIQGNYNGQLSARGETLTLMDGTRPVATTTYTGAPSEAQNSLRITEMLYHPGAQPGDTFPSDEYEFIELKNISPTTAISLAGVRFTNGIAFTFTTASLAPGATAVLVRHPAAFAQRFPAVTIAGTYTGSLDNAGERITLLDANNEEILDYTYEDDWYPATDGGGFALVCASETQDPDLWTLKPGWRPSGTVGGTPGSPDTVSDTDHDGLPDYAEWLGGTDPYSGQSTFTATPAGFTPAGAYTGSFPALTGRTYTVQWSPTLENPSWSKLQDLAPTTDGPVTFTDPDSATVPRRFYRVLTPASP